MTQADCNQDGTRDIEGQGLADKGGHVPDAGVDDPECGRLPCLHAAARPIPPGRDW